MQMQIKENFKDISMIMFPILVQLQLDPFSIPFPAPSPKVTITHQDNIAHWLVLTEIRMKADLIGLWYSKSFEEIVEIKQYSSHYKQVWSVKASLLLYELWVIKDGNQINNLSKNTPLIW